MSESSSGSKGLKRFVGIKIDLDIYAYRKEHVDESLKYCDFVR